MYRRHRVIALPDVSLLVITAMLACVPEAQAGQATAAPTRPVATKALSAPAISSDTRNLEAIVDHDAPVVAPQTATADPEPVPPAPQTILVMPSAAAVPPAPVPVAIPAPAPVALPQMMPPPPMGMPVMPPPEPGIEPGRWHRWLHDPTAVFTACIAFFTFLLALAGGWYVWNTTISSRRQMRSYIFITHTEISGVGTQTQAVAQLAIRNTGQTPAHDVVVYGNMVFDEFPLNKDLPVLVFSDPQLTKENLGPGNERYKWEYALTPLTHEQIDKMNAGTHALYVYGEIRYRDVFNKQRSTKYLYYTGGTMGIRGSVLGGYPEGNEAI